MKGVLHMYELDNYPADNRLPPEVTGITKRSNKCEICKKTYKFPGTIFKPRDKICASCERLLRNLPSAQFGQIKVRID